MNQNSHKADRPLLKQEYLYKHMPFSTDFSQEREAAMRQMFLDIKKFRINSWGPRGFDPLFLIERFRLTYGLYGHEITCMLTVFSNMLLIDEVHNIESKGFILKTLNYLLDIKIQLTGFWVDNLKLLAEYRRLNSTSLMVPVKHLEAYIQEFNTYTREVCQYGDDITKEVIKLAIEEKQLKYIALFIKCLKSEVEAQRLLTELLCQNGCWERDCHWFSIISYISGEFPWLDYSPYYHTIFQTMIKDFCIVADPVGQGDLDRILLPDDVTGVKSIMFSYSHILVNWILPSTNPMSTSIWCYIERLMGLITRPIDPQNQASFLCYYIKFIRHFVRGFLKRLRFERRLDAGKVANDEYVVTEPPEEWFNSKSPLPEEMQSFSRNPKRESYNIDEASLNEFIRIMKDTLPVLLRTEDESGCEISRICFQLSTLSSDFVDITLSSVVNILSRGQQMSLSTVKTILLFIFQHVIMFAPDRLHMLIECCNRMIELVEKLGLVNHIDMVQLILRMFMYFPADNSLVEALKTDLMDMIFMNIDGMSNVLQMTDNSQAELYLDLKNIFLPLLLKLDKEEVRRYADRLSFKALNAIPEHTEAYEMLLVGFSFIEPELPSLIIPGLLNQLLKPGKSQAYYDILPQLDCVLATTKEENIKWYSMIIECVYQYQPMSVVRDFATLQKIFTLLMKQEDVVLMECGWDILHNLVICLATKHLDASNFKNPANDNYKTLNIVWKEEHPQALNLLKYIIDRYVYGMIKLVNNRYKGLVINNVTHDQLIDAILVPKAIGVSALQEKKILTKIISIEQSVVAGVLPRTQNHPDVSRYSLLPILQPHMLPFLRNLRIDLVAHLNYVTDIMIQLHIVSEQSLSKIFSYLYNEVHGQSYISESLHSSQEKLTGFMVNAVWKPYKIMNCSFLTVNQLVLAYHCKMELLNGMVPTALLINPGHLKHLVIMSHHPDYTVSGKSFFDCSESTLHQYHRQVLNVWWNKLDYNNESSYIRKAESTKEPMAKERYSNAVSNIIHSLKKIGTYLAMECCVQDCQIRYMLFRFASLYEKLPKKKDRLFMVETLFALFSFQFDNTLIIPSRQLTFEQREQNPNRLTRTVNNPSYQQYVVDNPCTNVENRMEVAVNDIYRCLEDIEEQCIHKLTSHKHTKQMALYALFSLIYYPFVSNNRQLAARIFDCFQKMCSYEQTDLNQMGRVGIFHLVNTTKNKNISKQYIPNQPIKYAFNDFVIFRCIGCPQELSALVTLRKFENLYHPLPYLKTKQQAPIMENATDPFEATLYGFLSNPQRLGRFFKGCHADRELIEETAEDNDPIKTQGKAILHECLKLMNYLLDRDPRKANIFSTLVQNFSIYDLSFYMRLIKKMVKVCGNPVVKSLQAVAEELSHKEEIFAQKLYAYIGISILQFTDDQQFIDNYLDRMINSSNEVFMSHLAATTYVFRGNPFVVKPLYARVMEKLKKAKGSSRLRYIEVWKAYILNQGRWSREEALQGLSWILSGIDEASEELADGLVAVIVQTFTLPLNLKILPDWVEQPLDELLKNKRIFKLNDNVGFEINPKLTEIFQVITSKINEEKDIESSNLKMYTKLAKRILESLTIYQFNDYFFELLEGLINYLIEKQKYAEEGNEKQILRRLGEGQYPDKVYRKIKKSLVDIESCSLVIAKKKLKYLETLELCRSFSTNNVDLPEVLHNESTLTLNHITTLGHICRIMTPRELADGAMETMQSYSWKKYPLLMAYLLGSGNINYEWKAPALKIVVSWKMKRLVKEFVAYWWKGKGQGLPGEEALASIIKTVQNHYSYFA